MLIINGYSPKMGLMGAALILAAAPALSSSSPEPIAAYETGLALTSAKRT
jgi:hypothetical protein